MTRTLCLSGCALLLLMPLAARQTTDVQAVNASYAAAPGITVEEIAPARRETRPLRQKQEDLPVLLHHAGDTRFTLRFPEGDEQYERFRAAYLSAGGMKWLEAVQERARPYASYILERIQYYGLPEELFFLPFIESEFSAKAVSRSGAVGLWQFMRNSVGGYDMRIDDWVDERKDFMKATDGALKKLRWNYEHFGDWLLALAAYNCGVGALDKAIKKGDGSRDYWELREKGALPRETVSYIPKFLAVVSVAMHAGRNGLSQNWLESVRWERVALDRPVDLGMLAEASGIPLETLRQGNPELKYNVTPPDGRYAVKVPEAGAQAVRAALASSDKLMRVYIHKVNSGDTISAIAKYYEVAVPMIAKMNPGMNPDRIRIGQIIAIPALKDKKPYEAVRPAESTAVFNASYVVKKGDTLWQLSLAYNVQPEVLAEKNSLTLASILREGMSLVVPILE